MKLIIVIIIVSAIVLSILSYLDISIFTGIIAQIFEGEIWEGINDLMSVFGGFFTRLFSNRYILLIIGINIIFWALKLLVDFLRAKKTNTGNKEEKKESE